MSGAPTEAPAAGLLAGACEVDITPPLDVPLGSGFDPPPVQGIADPLRARALVLSDGAMRVAIACADILAVDPQLARDVRRLVAARTGIAPPHVMVCATHTHTCGGRLQPSRGNGDPALMELLARQIAGAVAAAADRPRPALILAARTAVDGVSVNRRDPAAPVDRALRVLRIDAATPTASGPAAGSEPLAVLTTFACHPTLVSHRHPLISADFPGVVARTLRDTLGPEVVVLPTNGACGDVNPVASGSDGLAAARRLGQVLGGEALALLARLWLSDHAPRAENTRLGSTLAVDSSAVADAAGTARPPLRAATKIARVPYKRFRPADDVDAEAAGVARRLAEAGTPPERIAAWQAGQYAGTDAPDARIDTAGLVARLLRLRSEAWAARVAAHQGIIGRGHREVELQAFALGPEIALLAVPFELFSRVGLDIAAASPFPHFFLIGYANDLGGYLMPDEEYAREGFEAGITFYGPGAADAVREAAGSLLRDLALTDAPPP